VRFCVAAGKHLAVFVISLSFQEDQDSAMANFPSKQSDLFVGKAFYQKKVTSVLAGDNDRRVTGRVVSRKRRLN
jgi:hypothetical protein